MIKDSQKEMALNNLDLDALEIFRTVAIEGGITRAANKLNRVQSNISTRIIQLEERLGVSLFNRVNRRLELTSEGELLLNYADRLLQLAEETDALFKEGFAQGNFRLGSMESTAAARLPKLLSTYHHHYPHIQIELMTDTTASLMTRVKNYELEAAFVAGPIIHPELNQQLAFTEKLVLITPRHKGFKQAKEAIGENLITFRSGCAYRHLLESWITETGGTIRNCMEMSSYHAIIACVAADTGIALVPQSVLQVISTDNMLQTLRLPEKYANIDTLLIWRKAYQARKLEAIRQFIKDNKELKISP